MRLKQHKSQLTLPRNEPCCDRLLSTDRNDHILNNVYTTLRALPVRTLGILPRRIHDVQRILDLAHGFLSRRSGFRKR